MPTLKKLKSSAESIDSNYGNRGSRITISNGAARGPEDFGRTIKIRGVSLGVTYTGPDGVEWEAVHWDDEQDPNWCKRNCIEFLE